MTQTKWPPANPGRFIEKFYAAHIKTTLDASAINVRKGIIQHERKSREGGDERPPRRGRKTREGVIDQA